MATEALGGEGDRAALSAADADLFTVSRRRSLPRRRLHVRSKAASIRRHRRRGVIAQLAGSPDPDNHAAMLATARGGALWMPRGFSSGALASTSGEHVMLQFRAINLTASWSTAAARPRRRQLRTRTIVAEPKLPRLLRPRRSTSPFPIALLSSPPMPGGTATPFSFETRLAGLNPIFCRAVGIECRA